MPHNQSRAAVVRPREPYLSLPHMFLVRNRLVMMDAVVRFYSFRAVSFNLGIVRMLLVLRTFARPEIDHSRDWRAIRLFSFACISHAWSLPHKNLGHDRRETTTGLCQGVKATAQTEPVLVKNWPNGLEEIATAPPLNDKGQLSMTSSWFIQATTFLLRRFPRFPIRSECRQCS